MTLDTISGRIRVARDQAGLTRKQLAEAVGVSVRAIQWWESGERTPRIEHVAAIARATGKPVDWFVVFEVQA